MDFTLSAYKQLISTLQSQCYFFQTFEEYIQNPKEKVVILRHDVDFSEVLYLTDTGRCWDGDEVSVRDKVMNTEVGRQRAESGMDDGQETEGREWN